MDPNDCLAYKSRLQSLEQKFSTLQRKLEETKELANKIVRSLNAFVDFINLDTQMEHPGFGSDLPRA